MLRLTARSGAAWNGRKLGMERPMAIVTEQIDRCEHCGARLAMHEVITCDPCYAATLRGCLMSPAWLAVRGPFAGAELAAELARVEARRSAS